MKSYLCNLNYIEKYMAESYYAWEKRYPEFSFQHTYEILSGFIDNCRVAHMISDHEEIQLRKVLESWSKRASHHITQVKWTASDYERRLFDSLNPGA